MSGTMARRLAMVAIFGPLTIVIVGSRWLSQISVGPVFLYDVILVVAFLLGAFALYIGRESLSRRTLQLSLVLLFLPALGIVHFAFSGVSEGSLREFAPYLYMSFGWLVMLLFVQLSVRDRRAGVIIIGVALALHWLWVSAIKHVPGIVPIEARGVTLFDIRADIDSTLVGAFAGYLLLVGIRPRLSWPKKLLLLTAAVFIGLQAADLGTRAGHLAAVAILSGVAMFAVLSPVFRGRRAFAVSTSLGITAVVLALPLFITGLDRQYLGAINALISTVAPDAPLIGVSTEASDEVEELVATSGVVISGTARARLNMWSNLIEWIFADSRRVFVGVGFGSDYLRESGSLGKFLGPLDRVTQEHVGPHNILLFVFATTGLVGLVLLVVLVSVALGGAVRGFRTASAELYGLSFALALGVLTVASFGQVFEAPYGAIPLAWCMGVLVSGYAARSGGGEDQQNDLAASSAAR